MMARDMGSAVLAWCCEACGVRKIRRSRRRSPFPRY